VVEVLAMGFSILVFTIFLGWQEGRKRETVRVVFMWSAVPAVTIVVAILIAGHKPYNPNIKIRPKNKTESIQPRGMVRPDWSENSVQPKELAWVTEARRLKRLDDKKRGQ
jgi:hypothetical protein